jgi:hypothetical protein
VTDMPTPSPSADLKALRELLAVVEVDRDTLDLDGLRLWNAAHAQLDMISPTLARTVLDQADRLEAITRDNERLAALLNGAESNCEDLLLERTANRNRATLAESALAEARQKLVALEAANERACSLRSGDAYAALIACPGMTDALYALDEARADARATIAKDKTP